MTEIQEREYIRDNRHKIAWYIGLELRRANEAKTRAARKLRLEKTAYALGLGYDPNGLIDRVMTTTMMLGLAISDPYDAACKAIDDVLSDPT